MDYEGKCQNRNNVKDLFRIGNKYGSIPTNLLSNFVAWCCLMALFFIIRKNLMGRLINTTKQSLHWTQIFFGKRTTAEKAEKNDSSGENTAPLTAEVEEDVAGSVIVTEENDAVVINHLHATDEETGSTPDKSLRNARVLTLKEKKLIGVMGSDAVQYLRFQKYIIIYVAFTTILSCGVILPLNLQGNQLGNATDFGHTTLANLNPNDEHDGDILWAHVFLGFIMFPLAVFLMRRFSYGLKMRDTIYKVTRTLAIENIPEIVCSVEYLRQHFSEAYPDFPIQDIQVVFNVTKLIGLRRKLENVLDSKTFCEKHKNRLNEDLRMYPVSCARCFGCCCGPCVDRVTCLDYLQEEELRLRKKIAEEEEAVRGSTLGMAFVTFHNINHARAVRADHDNPFKCRAKHSTLAMNPGKWRVWFAPPPGDIIWENLSNRRWQFTKKVLANIFIFLIAFFLTTPQYIVHQLQPIVNSLKNLTEINNTNTAGNSTDPRILEQIRYFPIWLTDILPTLLLFGFTWLLPVVIYYADFLVGHWTRSGQNLAIMQKTFWYLIFMVIVLPSFGFTTAMVFFGHIFLSDGSINWECIFLPDSGAFFVNYVITSALAGTGLELIRFGDLLYYLLMVCWSRSKADTPAIRKEIRYEFRFGDHYARMMLIFAMVTMFSMSCPLITPFGLLYFLLKHLVDRHNLVFVCARSKVNNKMHATAIKLVIMSVTLLQAFMVIFSFIRSQDSQLSISSLDWRTKISLLLFVVTVNVCSAQIWYHTCRKISPIKYEDVMLLEEKNDGHDKPYLPSVLLGGNSMACPDEDEDRRQEEL